MDGPVVSPSLSGRLAAEPVACGTSVKEVRSDAEALVAVISEPVSLTSGTKSGNLRHRSSTMASLRSPGEARRARLDRQASGQSLAAVGPNSKHRRSNSSKHLGRRILQHLLFLWYLTRKVWFQFVQPAAFFCASIWRRGTALGGFYVISAFVLIMLAGPNASNTVAARGSGCRLRHQALLVLAVVSFCLLLVGITLRVLCACSKLDTCVLENMSFVGLGGVGLDFPISSETILDAEPKDCRNPLKLIPEVVAAAASVIGAVLGRSRSLQHEISLLGAPTLTQRVVVPVLGLVLAGCASLFCSVFTALYLLCAASLLYLWANQQPHRDTVTANEARFLRVLRFVLAAGGTAHVLVVCVFSAPTFVGLVPRHVLRLLGVLSQSRGVLFVQTSFAFFMLELLAAFTALAAASEAELACEDGDASLADVELVPRTSTQNSSGSNLSLAPRRQRTRSDASHRMSCCTRIMQVFSAVDSLVRTSLVLPLGSALLWATVWPAASTLPILLGGLFLLHAENSRLPLWLFKSALAYQIALALAVYGYNVYCDAWQQPFSGIPAKFTVAERAGLQSYNRFGNSAEVAAHIWYVMMQVAAVVALALAVGARGSGTEVVHKCSEELAIVWRNAVAWARPFTLIVVLSLSISSMSFSLLGLGYIMWILSLVISGTCVGYQHSGWDLLRGHATIWYSLLLYSNLIVVALFCWQVVGETDLEVVGLRRAPVSLVFTTWPHILISALAALQVHASRVGVRQPVYFLMSTSLLGWLVRVAGIFVHMGLVFFVAMVPPKSLDSGIFLLLYVCTVGVEQWDPSAALRNHLLLLCAMFAALLIPLRYAILLQPVQELLVKLSSTSVLHQRNFVLESLAIIGDKPVEMKLKLFLLVLVVVVAATLRRMFLHPHMLLTARAESQLRRGVSMWGRFVREIARWSVSILIFMAYFLMRKDTGASVVQIGLLLVLLVKGRKWEWAGVLISGCSMVMLLLQFWWDLQYVPLDQDQRKYFDLSWNWQTVNLEVLLLFLGIVQRSLQRAAAHLQCTSDSAIFTSRWRHTVRRELSTYGAQIAAIMMLFMALFRSSVWSLVYGLVVLLFQCSGGLASGLPPVRTNVWLRMMAWVQGLSLFFRIFAAVWLPPQLALPSRPSAAFIGGTWACAWVDSTLKVECGAAWMSWLDLDGSATDSSPEYFPLSFLALFLTCGLRNLCLRELRDSGGDKDTTDLAESDVSPGARSARSCRSGRSARSSRSDGAADRLRSKVLLGRREPCDTCDALAMLPLHRNLIRSTARSSSGVGLGMGGESPNTKVDWSTSSPARPQTLKMQVAAWAAGFGHLPRHRQRRLLPHIVHGSAAVLLWFSLGFAALSQKQTSLITLGYFALLFVHLITTESTQTLKDPFGARIRLLRYIRGFNIVVCLLFVIFQLPVVPCPFEDRSTAPERTTFLPRRFFTTSHECLKLQNFQNGYGGSIFTIIVQCIGLRKLEVELHFAWSPFWNMMVFVAALAQSLACARWSAELTSALSAEGRRFDAREKYYFEHLLRWRRWELNRVDLRHKVLLLKLDLLMHYLNEVRAVWANRRDRIMPEERAAHDNQTRIYDLCLRSGASEVEVREVLVEYEGVVKPLLFEGLPLQVCQKIASIIDDCVCDRLERLAKFYLRAISASEDAESAAEVLARCIKEASVVIHEFVVVQPSEHGNQVDDADSVRQNIETNESSGKASTLTPPSAEKRAEKIFQDMIDTIKAPVRRCYEAVINDFLFMREGDETLGGHRRQDALLTLLAKAMLSQTFFFLVIAAMIQFVASMSIFSSVTVSTILLTLMVFPHAPPVCWKGLQVYNVVVILIKMIYQLPNISAPDIEAEVPWQAVLGLLKVVPGGRAISYLECSSLAEALWADLLVCAALLCHWHALRQSGCLSCPHLICQRLAQDDTKYTAMAMISSMSLSSPGGNQGRSPRSEAHAPLRLGGGRQLHFVTSDDQDRFAQGASSSSCKDRDGRNDSSCIVGLGESDFDVGPTSHEGIPLVTASSSDWPPVNDDGHYETEPHASSPSVFFAPPLRGKLPIADCGRCLCAGSGPGSGMSGAASTSARSPPEDGGETSVRLEHAVEFALQTDRVGAASDAGVLEADGSVHLEAGELQAQGSDQLEGEHSLSEGSMDEDDEICDESSGTPLSHKSFQAIHAQYGSLAARARDVATKLGIGATGMRKPAWDLYSARLGLSIVIFIIVFLGWNQLTETKRSIYESVTSFFSGQQAVVLTLVLVLIVQNRAEYTWYTQERAKTNNSASEGIISGGIASAASMDSGLRAGPRGTDDGQSRTGSSSRLASSPPNLGTVEAQPTASELLAPILQKTLLLVQLVAVHTVYICMWVNQDPGQRSPSMAGNSYQVLLYCVYVAYLALTSMQLKYDVHVIRGGLSLTQNTDLITGLALKVYLFVPFAEELRVLSDWTVTKTSLDFFMWMKLEDAHQTLAITARDMLVRRMIPRGAPRPRYEKVFQGGFLLVILLALIVGPIMFFSTLNPSLKSNIVSSATLRATLFIRSPQTGEKSSLLYQASQKRLNHVRKESERDVFDIEFPELSETYWLTTPTLRQQMSNLSRSDGSETRIAITCTFDVMPGDYTSLSHTEGTLASVLLNSAQITSLQNSLNEASVAGSFPIFMTASTGGMKTDVVIDSRLEVSVKGSATNTTMTLTGSELEIISLPYWSLITATGSPRVRVTTDKVAPSIGSSPSRSGGLEQAGVLGIYTSIVYLIGRLLRAIFQDSSKRIIYEELPDTTLLRDLCNGIYIARIQGRLDMEYKLYYQLIQIFRSPELLLDVSRAADRHTDPNGVHDEEAGHMPKRVGAPDLEDHIELPSSDEFGASSTSGPRVSRSSDDVADPASDADWGPLSLARLAMFFGATSVARPRSPNSTLTL